MALGWETLPRISEFIRRFSGQEEIVPPGLSLTERAEWLQLMGIRAWTTGPVQVAAAAGNRGKVEIPNLATSMIIVVTSAVVLNSQLANGVYQLTIDGPAQGTPTQNFARDTRLPGILVQSINRIGNAAGGVGGFIVDEITVGLNADGAFRHVPYVITPGHNLQLWSNAVNLLLRAMLAGYEFNARAEELVV